MTDHPTPQTVQLPARYRHIYAGHNAGAFTLPVELLALRDALRTIDSAVAELPSPQAARAQEALIPAIADAAAAGQPLPGLDDVDAATEADRRTELLRRLLRAARELSEARIASVVAARADEIRAALAAALDDVVAQARQVTIDMGGLADADDRDLLDAPTKVRAAAVAAAALAARHGAIREAERQVPNAAVEWDTNGLFASYAQPALRADGRSAWANQRPWADTSRGFVVWLGRNADELRPWVPTAEQRDAAWLRRFPAARRGSLVVTGFGDH